MTIDSIGEKIALVVKEWWREMIVVAWFILAFLIHYDWVQGIKHEAMFLLAIIVIRLIQHASGVRRQEGYSDALHHKMNDYQSYSSRFPYRVAPGNHGGEFPPRPDEWSSISTNQTYNNGYQDWSSSYRRAEEDYWRNHSSYQFDNSWSSISTNTTYSSASFDPPFHHNTFS